MRLSSVLNRLLFSINRRSDIILRIAKVREEMNKKMSVFCANPFVQQRNFKVRMDHISLFDVEEVVWTSPGGGWQRPLILPLLGFP